jgi:hypothetical protein
VDAFSVLVVSSVILTLVKQTRRGKCAASVTLCPDDWDPIICNFDGSMLTKLARRWAPQIMACIQGESAHTARRDALESITELRCYRTRFAKAVQKL